VLHNIKIRQAFLEQGRFFRIKCSLDGELFQNKMFTHFAEEQPCAIIIGPALTLNKKGPGLYGVGLYP
jgi:hypothetical protein